MQRTFKRLSPFVMTALMVSCPFGLAQRIEARLTGMTEGARAVLPGSRSPHAQRGQDLGPVSPEMKVPGITLAFKRSAGQQSALEELLAAQQNPSSPLYHQWLKPETFQSRFGVAEADIATTKAWLKSHGFQIDESAPSRDRITFSGTAAQVQSAFGADLHHYEVDGEVHFAPASDLTLPAELAPMTAAVLHLSDFRPKPSIAARNVVQPEFTSGSTQAHYLTPKDVLTMYGLTSPAIPSSRGDGQSLVVVGQSYVNTGVGSSVYAFQFATSVGKIATTVLVPGSGVEAISPGDEGESELDLEYSSGIAQGANVFLVYVGVNQNYSVFDSIDFAITTNIAPVISVSYGACESLLSATELDQSSAMFQQATAQGQTIVAASGDSGSTACAGYPTSSGVTAAQQQALAVSYPASSPYVTAVGGTQMAAGTFTAGSSTYWSTATSGDSVSTLLSYVPELVWNEGSVTHGIIAGGGGSSGHFARPAWQAAAPGIVSGPYRLVPDIALQSSVRAPGFLLCTSDHSLSGSQTSCTNGLLGSTSQYTVAGGTSFATPIFAGMLAILNQLQQTNGQGNINPTLYHLASDPATYANVFHDITSGSIACVPGASSCGAPGQSGYAATPGYDQATGLGSFDFGKLLSSWPVSTTTAKAATTTAAILNQNTATAGSSLPVQVTVVSTSSAVASTQPTGTVSVSLDGVMVQPALALPGNNPTSPYSIVSFTFTAPAVAGSHVVTVTYSGDSTHAPSEGAVSVLVGTVTPSGSFTLATNNLSIISGSTGTDQVTITPVTGYSGRVTWGLSVASSSTGTALSACYGIGSPAVNGASTTTLTIGVGSACTSSSASGSVSTFVSDVSPQSRTPPWRSAPRLAMYAGLLLFGLVAGTKGRARLPQLLAVALLTLAGFSLAGCGSSSSNATVSGTTTPPPATAGSVYTLTLKGTDSVNSSITASTTFTLTVN